MPNNPPTAPEKPTTQPEATGTGANAPEKPTTQPEATQVPEEVKKINISNEIKDNLFLDLGQLSPKTKVAFLTKLHEKLKEIPSLKNIKTSDYDVYKGNSNDTLEDNDIIINLMPSGEYYSLRIRIVANSHNFNGEKFIIAFWWLR